MKRRNRRAGSRRQEKEILVVPVGDRASLKRRASDCLFGESRPRGKVEAKLRKVCDGNAVRHQIGFRKFDDHSQRA
jgi:hypothetical protein